MPKTLNLTEEEFESLLDVVQEHVYFCKTEGDDIKELKINDVLNKLKELNRKEEAVTA